MFTGLRSVSSAPVVTIQDDVMPLTHTHTHTHTHTPSVLLWETA